MLAWYHKLAIIPWDRVGYEVINNQRGLIFEADFQSRKIAFDPLKYHTTDTIMFQFGKQNLLVKSVKRFRKV